ncbi:MAG: PAS domain S-box protein [Leptolyngbyaceae bacterium]|nr:PAS domain S-box protein [Leptolyngbyaceae bacterium]
MSQPTGQNRRKNLWVLGALISVSWILMPWGTTTKAQQESPQPESPQVVRVGLYENQPKMFTDENGDPAGFYADILRSIAEQENWAIEYVPCIWQQCLASIESGDLDLMPDVAYSEERDRRFNFNQKPFFVSWSVVYTHAGITVDSILDLDQKRVAVLRGSIQYDVLAQQSQEFDIDPQFVEVDDFDTMFQLLANGDVDAGVVNRFFGTQAEPYYPSIKATPILVHPSQLYAIASDGNAALLAAVDRHLIAMKADPTSTYYQALERWLEPTDENTWVHLRYVLLGMVASAAIVGVASMLVWNRKLAKEVKERKQAEEQLRESEQRFRNAIAHAPFPIIIYADDGEVLQLSSTWTELTGYIHDDIPTIQAWAEKAYGDRASEVLQEYITPNYDIVARRDEGDFTITTKANRKRIWQFSSSPLGTLADGRRVAISMAVDVTDHRKIAHDLRESEAQSRAILAGIPDLIFRVGADEVYRGFSTSNRAHSVVPPEIDIQDRSMAEVLPPEMVERQSHYLKRALETGHIQMYEQQVKVGDRLQEEEVRVVKSGDDEVLFIVRDISERKRSEAERLQTAKLRSELTLIENLFETVLAGYWDWDIPNHVEYYSPGFKRMFGYEDHELANVPESWQSLIFPEDLSITLENYKSHVKSRGKIPYCNEVRYRHKDGSTVWVISSGQVIEWDAHGNPLRMIGCHLNISARKHAEQALAASETRLKTLINALPFGVWVRDAEDTLILQNSIDIEHYGNQLGTRLDDLNFLPEHIARYQAHKAKNKVGEPYSWETMERVNGEDRSFLRIETLWNEPGKGIGMLGVAIDVTELKQTKEALQISEERLSTLVNALPLGIWVRDARGRLVLQNSEDIARFGKIIGTDLESDSIPSEWASIHDDIKQRCLVEGPIQYERQEVIHGELRTFLQINATLPDLDGGVGLFGVSIDITDRKRSEEQIHQYALQLESINKELEMFTYSVSHDLRAPLRHIGGFISALKQQLEETNAIQDANVAHYLKRIQGSSKKMTALIEGLLTLSRVGRREMAQRAVNLQKIVRAIMRSMQSLPPEEVRLDDSDTPSPDMPQTPEFIVHELPTVEGDETLLYQAFYNLIDNAVKFSRDRHPPRIEIGVLEPSSSENQYTIFIKDNGVGFDMTYADQLFAVFQRLHSACDFTGTGIGLSIVQRIIHRHGGEIWADSHPDSGACFYVKLKTAAQEEQG